MTPSRRILTATGVYTLAITLCAVAADFILNVLVMKRPARFTPGDTAIIATLVGAPISFWLCRQSFKIRLVQERLAAGAAEKDRIVAELQLRRHEAERSETKAQNALRRLGESEARYRLMTDRMTDIVVRYDRAGVIEFASPSVRRLGYEPDAMLGRNMAEFTHPEEAAAGLASRTRVTRTGEPPHPRDLEIRARCADGRYVWLEGSPAPFTDENGVITAAVTVLRDITARRAVEDELRLKRAEAEAAVVAKSDFLANMTHELRTPLNAIVGFSGLLKQSTALNPRDRHQVELIGDASETLLHVVNDVLDYSKLEAGAIELDGHAFDPAEVAESICAIMGEQAARKNLTLSVAADGLTGPLMGDGARLRQVLLNLVSNAIKFTARGGVTIRIAQSLDARGRNLRVEVSDTGIGLAADQLDTIFGRFTQADASVSRKFGGTGLGLAISKRIVEAMGGQIGVNSARGEGATFWFEVVLPTAEAQAQSQAAAPARLPAERTLRLLLVEDNAVNRELICTLLAPFDLDIETATDGVEAVEAVARARFDLILMDVQMPNMDGLTATARIRAAADPLAPRTPIIAMTANVMPEQIARCLEAGMDDHLGKPIEPAKLLEMLACWTADEPASAPQVGSAAEQA